MKVDGALFHFVNAYRSSKFPAVKGSNKKVWSFIGIEWYKLEHCAAGFEPCNTLSWLPCTQVSSYAFCWQTWLETAPNFANLVTIFCFHCFLRSVLACDVLYDGGFE